MADIPDGYEGFSKEEIELIYEKLQDKGASFKSCDLCATNDWVIFPVIVSPTILIRNKSTKVLKEWDGKAFDQIVFSCKNCGNSKYLEIHFLGIKLSNPDGGGDI